MGLQGNPSFGPLPIESDPQSLDAAGDLMPAGHTPMNGGSVSPTKGYEVAPAGYITSNSGRMVDELGGERSMRRRSGRRTTMLTAAGRIGEDSGIAEEDEVGEGSTMEIEED